jgi:hypothetical protein
MTPDATVRRCSTDSSALEPPERPESPVWGEIGTDASKRRRQYRG